MFYKNFFPKGTAEEDVLNSMTEEGFPATRITDTPGFIYDVHTHKETKLIACLKGSMEVTVEGKKYDFEPGDKLLIDANTPHSAVVGPEGCIYFWSEKVI